MKKILTLFTALFLMGGMMMVQADYYVAGTMNNWNAGHSDYKMSGSGPYSVTKQLGTGNHQFKITSGSWSWSTAAYDKNASNVTLSEKDGNIAFSLTTTCDVTFYYSTSSGEAYVQATPVVVPSYTFPAGTTIYYDFTAYGSGVNVCINGSEPWHNSTSAIFSETLNNAWEVTATTNLFKSAPNSWSYKTCSTLPTEGQNMLVGDANGIGCHWDTYSGEAPEPTPATIKLHGNFTGSWTNTAAFVLAGNEETASLTLTNIAKGDYQFGVRIGADDNWTSNGSAYTRANPSHAIAAGSGNCTFKADVAGDYTFTWTYATNTLAVTYPALPTYTVDFVDLASDYFVNDVVTFNATSTGVDNPTYTYYVKKGSGSYGSAVTSYTFAETGSYTVKVEVRENGAGDALKTEVQTVTVDNPLTLYFVNKDAWANVNIYFFNPGKTDWPGDPMTATGDHTALHNYAVYSYTVPASTYSSANVIFNGGGTQTGDLSVNAKHYYYDGEWYATLAECDQQPAIKMHGNFLGDWATTDAFVVAAGNATASLSLTIPAKGAKEFGMRIGSNDNWTSNGASITRASASAVITSGDGNCSLNADIPGEYTFTWTYATNTLAVTYPELPEQYVEFDGLSAEILKGTAVNFAATSTGITNPVYTYYVKPEGGEYGDAVASYTFNAEGSFTVKVSAEGDNTAAPVVAEVNVVVYESYTFTSGTTIYVDFSAVSGDVKGVNYPKTDQVGMDWDGTGAGSMKTVVFTANVTWTSLAESFIKTEKAGWAALKFKAPENDQNCAVVAADGASYSWTTIVPPPPTIKLHGNFTGDWGTTDAFVLAGNEETASLTLTSIGAGNYEFGVRIGSDDNWTSNGSAFTYENNSHAIEAGSGNCTFNANRNGNYTFTWTFATNTLTITYPEPDVFVAGSEADIFGTTWDASAVANKMIWDEDLSKYTKTYTVDKAYKSVGLKVVYDGSWYGVEGGEDNVKFSLSGAGDFKVLFDKTTHYVTLDGAIVGEEQFDFAYAAVAANGEGNWAHGEDWNAATTTNRMTEVAENIWEISFDNVPAKECELKFCFDGTWDHEFGGVFSAFGTESPAVYGNTAGKIIFSSVAGSIITIRLDLSNFNFATKEGATFTVSQVEPEPQFESVRDGLSQGWYYTICLDKAVADVRGGSILKIVSKAANASDVILEEVALPLEAGRPYIFQASAENLEVVYTGAAVNGPVNDDANNGLIGSFIKASITPDANNYIIYNNMLYLVNSDNVYVGAHRAYLNMTDVPAYDNGSAPAPGRRRVVMAVHSEQVATGIEDVQGDKVQSTKVLIDGHIYILRGEKMYDATGRLVK